jgi:hypothetical protein
MSSSKHYRTAAALLLSGLILGEPAWLELRPTLARAEETVRAPAPPVFDKSDPSAYGRSLAQYMDAYDSGWRDQYSKSRVILRDANGDSVSREFRQMVLEGSVGDKSLVRFMSPPDVRGVSALTHEHRESADDTWLYLPATRRVRRISGANRAASFQGTEFTYEDLASLSPDRYDWKFLKEDTSDSEGAPAKLFVLEAVPRQADTGYSKLVLFVSQQHWRIEKIDFFDRSGRKLKTLTTSSWKLFHGRYWRAQATRMVNDQTHKETAIEIDSLLLDLSRYPNKDGTPRKGLTEDQFEKRALELP